MRTDSTLVESLLSITPLLGSGCNLGHVHWRVHNGLVVAANAAFEPKFEGSSSYFSFKHFVPGAFKKGFIGPTCTALPCPQRPSQWPSRRRQRPPSRGLHSSTFRLNLSAFCRIGVHSVIIYEVLRRCQWGIKQNQGVFRVYFVTETAQVELKSGRV